MRASLRHADTSLAFHAYGGRQELVVGEDFVPFGSVERDDVVIEGNVVFAGYGITSAERKHDDYRGIDVRGKVVALLPDAPEAFPHNVRPFYGSRSVKEENAEQHGALAVLHLTTIDEPATWNIFARSATLDTYDFKREQPGVDGNALLSYKTSEALFRGATTSFSEVVEHAKTGGTSSFNLPVRATLRISSRRIDTESPNVVGILRGSRRPDEYLVYTAHLDHEGISDPVNGDAIYNGAVDNASGVAAMLGVARAFVSLPQRPDRSVLFLATTAEEPGLLGADYFVRHSLIRPSGIIAALNIDGASMLYPLPALTALGARNSDLGRAVDAAADQLGVTIRHEEIFPGGSDHYPFVKQGIPSVWLLAALGAEFMKSRYHTPHDDMSQEIDFRAIAVHAQLNFLIGYAVTQNPDRPRWHVGDFFGEKFHPGQR
jgi:hypothetical protein